MDVRCQEFDMFPVCIILMLENGSLLSNAHYTHTLAQRSGYQAILQQCFKSFFI